MATKYSTRTRGSGRQEKEKDRAHLQGHYAVLVSCRVSVSAYHDGTYALESRSDRPNLHFTHTAQRTA